jgi:hypothetical protein
MPKDLIRASVGLTVATAELASELLSSSPRKDPKMNQAPISPGLPAPALGLQDYPSPAAAAPGEQGFAGELTLALGGQVAAGQAETVSAESDSEPAIDSGAGLQNMPAVLPWLPTMAANFSTSTAPQAQTVAVKEAASGQALAVIAGGPTHSAQAQGGVSAPVLVPGDGTGSAAAQPESGRVLTQALAVAHGPAAQPPTEPSQLQAGPSVPAKAAALPPDAPKSSFQAITTPPVPGLDTNALGSASSASPAQTAAPGPQPQPTPATEVKSAQDFQQTRPTAAELASTAAQTAAIQSQTQAKDAKPTSPAEPAAKATGQILSAQHPSSGSPVPSQGTQGLDPLGSAPGSADVPAASSTHGPVPGNPDGARTQQAQAAASAAAGTVTQPAVSGLPQAEHASSPAPSEPAMARLGIEASPTPAGTSESADTAAEALQSQAAAAPVASESSGAARAEPLSWSSSPVATSAGSGPTGSAQAQPTATPSVDMSLPIKPHWVSLESGAVQVEVLRMARDGGGQVTLELTPPDQGRYRLDLRIDDFGRASLVVEGASESMRTRLEMGESSLREQFAQLGLQLSLQMRSQQGQPDPSETGNPSPAWAAGPEPVSELAQGKSAPRRAVALDLERSLVRLYA